LANISINSNFQILKPNLQLIWKILGVVKIKIFVIGEPTSRTSKNLFKIKKWIQINKIKYPEYVLECLKKIVQNSVETQKKVFK